MADEATTELTPDQILTGERNYATALGMVIAAAERELLIFDEDLSRGDFASIARFDLLRNFLSKSPSNRLQIILHDSRHFTTRCPRLYRLLANYGHSMQVYETDQQAKVARDAFVIADQRHYLRRFHVEQARFRFAFDDMETAQMLNMRFEELLQCAPHTVSVTQLGL